MNDITDRKTIDAVFVFLSLSGIYWLLRLWSGSSVWQWIILAVSAAAGIQLFIGTHQSFVTGARRLYLTASFHNAGYFANYLISFLPLSLAMSFTTGIKLFLRFLFGVLAVTAICLLLITGARAAWMGLLSSGFAAIWLLRLRLLPKVPKFLWAMLALGAAGFLAGALYFFRPDSVRGRLTIYQVSLKIIKDHPLLGVGPNRFAAVYGLYQSRYLRQHSLSEKSQRLATDGFEAFNLPIQVWVEYGWAGLLLLIYGLAQLYRLAKKIKMDQGPGLIRVASYCSLISLLVAGLFSNAFHSTPIQLMTAMHLAAIYPQPVLARPVKAFPPWKWVFGLAVVAGIVWTLGIQHRAGAYWRQAALLAKFGEYRQAKPLYSRSRELLNNDGYFLYNFGAEACSAGDYTLAIELLEKARRYISSWGLYCYLGDALAGEGRFEDAEDSYLLSVFMVPSLIVPKYQLLRLYRRWGKRQEENRWTKIILASKPKVRSALTDQIYQELMDKEAEIQKR